MEIPYPEESATNNRCATIEVDEEIEGDVTGTKNYRFSRIGEPVPIKSEPDSGFDPECIPSQPLAISERFRLLFVAHPDGFCVARTKEVIAVAEEFKNKNTGRSVQELSFVYLPIGKVSILALSADDSVLAATVGRDIHFFAVSALLHKEQKPSFSVSLDGSSYIKDMRWSRRFEKVYVLLSTDGKLYHGSGQAPFNYMLDNVDCVDWSEKGNFVAVARKNVLSILSSQFKEKLRLSLPFKSVLGDSDVNQVIKVDAIRWIRPDCIVVGCFLLNADGEEENYLVQVITSKGSKITDVSASSKPIVLSFENIFLDFRPDDVPVARGPHLFLSYLDHYGLAFIANRKNLSQHVVLFCWSLDHGENEAAMIDILNDAWVPHIECQGDGEDNMILGLGVDKVSQNEHVKFTLGDEETEVSPCCILVCLTVDGKISIFHFASAISASVSSKNLADSGEDEDASHVSSLKHEPAQISLEVKEESGEQTFSRLESHELMSGTDKKEKERVTTIANAQPSSLLVNIKSKDKSISENQERKPLPKLQTSEADEPKTIPPIKLNKDSNIQTPLFAAKQDIKLEQISFKTSSLEGSNELMSGTDKKGNERVTTIANAQQSSLLANIKSEDESISENQERKLLPKLQTSEADEPKTIPPIKLNKDSNIQTPLSAAKQEVKFEQLSFKTSSLEGSQPFAKGFSKTGDKSISEVKSSPSSFSGKVLSLSNNQQTGSSMESRGKMASTNLQNMRPSTWSSGKVDSLKTFDERPLLLPSQGVERGISNKSDISASQLEGDSLRDTSHMKERAGPSVTFNSSGQRSATETGNIHSLPAHRGSPVSMQGRFTLGKSFEAQPIKENHATRSPTGSLYSETNVSKQFSNVEEMANKLNNLLEGIEGKGGFKDASVASQEKAVLELEDGTWALSDRCRMWKGIMDKQQTEVQLLFDKTVQVLARKIYVEGIFKQATDSRYWDLWNRQKLSPELELKSRHILDLDQELTNQMIELERHFNALELNKFGENREMQTNRKAFQSWRGQSRHLQDLHSLHSTMSAQLAAAERLSESLSKQMAALNIESSAKEQDVKKKLFESIGLSYTVVSHSSPSKERALDTLSNKELLITSRSVSTKEQSSRHQANLSKGYDPETVRRRRDSLDRSWARFEPPKTTVKRMLLHEDGELSANRSLFTGDKQDLTPRFQKGPEVARSALSNLSAASLFQPKNREDQSTERSSQSFAQQTARHLDRGMQVLSTKHSALTSQPALETVTTRDIAEGTCQLTNEKSSNQSQPHVVILSSTSLQSTLSSSLPSTINTLSGFPSFLSKPTVPTSSLATPPNSKASVDTNHEASQAQTSVSSSLNFPSTLSLSTPEMSGISSISQPRLESPKSSIRPSVLMFGTKTDGTALTQTSIANLSSTVEESITTQAAASKVELSTPISDSKLEPSVPSSTTEFSTRSKPGNQIDLDGMLSSSSDVASNIKPEEPCAAGVPLPTAVSSAGFVPEVKHVTPDASHEDEMDEEAPETDQTTELALGNLTGFGLGSTPNSTAASSNPFGVAVLNRGATPTTSTFTMSGPSGELFRPSSFNFQSLQPSQELHPTTNFGAFSGGFNSGITSQAPTVSGFGQQAHIGSGQQVLESVLGGFGQSRQLGAGLTGASAASASGFGSGFMGVSSTGSGGGFAAASTGGGFASLASGGGGFAAAATGGGFAAAATGGGGFAAAATGGGGFSSLASGGGGFAAAAGPGGGFSAAGIGGGGFVGSAAPAGGVIAGTGAGFSGGGFGAFGNQQGGGFGGFGNQQGGAGGFSAFGSSSGAGRPPAELLTQMRK